MTARRQRSDWDGGPAWMTRALSKDLCERVVSAVFSGESCRAVRFGVAVFVDGGSFGIPPDSVNPL
jgi:hypothetical protein